MESIVVKIEESDAINILKKEIIRLKILNKKYKEIIKDREQRLNEIHQDICETLRECGDDEEC